MPYQTKLPQAVAVVSPVLGEHAPAVISFKETALNELFSTNLLVVFTVLLLYKDHEVPLYNSKFKLLSVSPFKFELI